MRRTSIGLAALVLCGTPLVAMQAAGNLQDAIGKLGSLDYEVRTDAARTVRRVPAPEAIQGLAQAAQGHADGYVRYRASILLAGFSDAAAAPLMRAVLTDSNDRLRQVAYNFYEHNPARDVLPLLLGALDREESEFVRPALIRALAAQGGDPRVRETLLVEVDRGVDFFRSAVIEALGDVKADYAVSSLLRIAQLDGPLQDDAVLALGKIGNRRALESLVGLQRQASRITQPAIAAAICLHGVNCDAHLQYLEDTLRFGIDNSGFQDLLRAASAALGALALTGNSRSLATLFALGIPSRDPARAPIALAVGLVALRNTEQLLAALASEPDVDAALLLVRDAFDMLNEDFEEERFFVAVRRAFWESPESSARRAIAERLVQTLEF
jgi:HEAT repeat protein